MIALVRGMSSEGALWAATHDSDGKPKATLSTTVDTPAPTTGPKVVTSLAGVDPRRFRTGELTWA